MPLDIENLLYTFVRPLVPLGVALLLYIYFSRRQTKRAAGKIVEGMKATFGESHEYREVRARDFAGLDLEFYNACEADLRGRGFQFVADVEDITLTRVHPNMRTFLRWLRSPDGAVCAAIYDVKPRGWIRLIQRLGLVSRDLRTVEFQTEFANGEFMATVAADPSNLLRETPGIHRLRSPRGTPCLRLLELHEAMLAQFREEHPDLTPVPCFSLPDMIESEERMRIARHAHREATGYLTREEMRSISHPRLRKTGDAVMDEIEKRDRST